MAEEPTEIAQLDEVKDVQDAEEEVLARHRKEKKELQGLDAMNSNVHI